jgi:uncharacterized damage-inducible protein DinB
MNDLPFFLAEFKQEAQLTRSFLAKVPFDNPSYKPHPKSETLGRLAIHVAEIIAWWKNVLEENEMDFINFKPEKIETTEALLSYFDSLYQESLIAFENSTEEVLEQDWTMKNGDEIYMTLPKKQILRRFCMNHLVHHRAQLGVYLRLLDIEHPATYGPSADDVEVSLLERF